MKKVLITGGAGYIGTELTSLLLESGYEVTVYDTLMYDGAILIPFFKDKNFNFVKGDILDKEKLSEVIKNKDVVIHLAAIVGYFACDKNKRLSTDTNVLGTQNVIDCMSEEQLLLFGSTGSNYGKVDGICLETTPLNPSTLYGETKTEAEDLVIEQHKNSIAYRFATAFGVSPRLRMDLLLNDLAYKAITDGCLVIYQSSAMRTFIHVRDMAMSFLFAIHNAEKMAGEVYNCGSNNLNYSKRDVCEMIKEKTNCYVHYNDFDYDKDNRDYEVSYDKLHNLGFDVSVSVEEGIDELLSVYKVLNFVDKRYLNIGFPEIN
jgi:nucleoside-diphosphate-sugar epimerase